LQHRSSKQVKATNAI